MNQNKRKLKGSFVLQNMNKSCFPLNEFDIFYFWAYFAIIAMFG